MLKCEINIKEDIVYIAAEGDVVEYTNDLSILFDILFKSGLRIECPVAALVSAVNDEMDQDDYNQCCTVILDLLKAIKDK